ncbi:Ctr copper transporter [Aureobasidium pullulans]|nr:Ctr copper transporter [Aureobasidium pullulans]
MSHSMSMGGGNSTECKISMLWNWYTIDACFLASSWHIKTKGMFAASCIGVALLVVCLEFLRRIGKEYDSYILRQFHRRAASLRYRPRVSYVAPKFDDERNSSGCGPDASCAPPLPEQQFITFRATPAQQITRGAIHAATFGVGYIVMLLAMYFNGYVIISIIVGAFLGKVLCDWMVVKLPLVTEQSFDESRDEAPGISEPTVCCG